jgi:hypothetical protein
MNERPIIEANSPRLATIRYRPARFTDVKASMVRALSDARRPGLQMLGARDDRDHTIALLDAFAALADSVGFYVERSAREAWLRTAEEPLSIRMLARQVGYEPRPAIAAEAQLAFELVATADAPARLELPPGMQVQSIPGPGELPQTFETIEPLIARPIWNAIAPRRFASQDADPMQPDASKPVRWVTGVGLDLRPGRPVIHVHQDNAGTHLAAHDAHLVRRVARITPERDLGRTRIEFEPPPGTVSSSLLDLIGRIPHPGLVFGAGLFQFYGSISELERFQIAQFVTRASPPPPDPNGAGVFVLDISAPLFAHDRVPKTTQNGLGDGPADGNSKPTLARENAGTSDPAYIHLDAVYEQIAAGTWVVLVAGDKEAAVRVQSRTDLTRVLYGVSRRVTRLAILRNDLKGPDGATASLADFRIIDTTIHALPRRLPMMDLPISDPIGHGAPAGGDDTIELDALYLDLEPGKRVILTGTLTDAETGLAGVTFSEARKVLANDRGGVRSIIRLDRPLDRQYDRDSVVIRANVALATNGESFEEPIASGEAIAAFKPIPLKKKPVTYVSAPTPIGGVTTLEIWVDGVKWERLDDLAQAGPNDHVYLERQSEDGTTSVVFGDGASGALPASRTENIRASYRAGSGSAGRVKADTLSLLKSRPQGLKDVTNPIAAAGGADGEAMADARDNAPLHALTLGRVVSLQDYEDFARSFGPIAKARADWVWSGSGRTVYLTVAGEDGAPLAGSTVLQDLKVLLQTSGDAFVRLQVVDHRAAEFTLAVRVAKKPDRKFAAVREAVEAALRASFGFGARAFGQSVTRAEVIATVQAVDGVDHVDLDLLHRVSDEAANEPGIAAGAPRSGTHGEVLPAELLTLTRGAIGIEEMS